MKKSFHLLAAVIVFLQVFSFAAHAQKKTGKKTAKKEIPTVHIVKSGETLNGLSAKYGVSINDLKKTNPQLSKGLQKGQKIRIPSKSEARKNAEKPATASGKKVPAGQTDKKASTDQEKKSTAVSKGKEVKTDDGKIHTVKKGETLAAIARKYNLTPAELKSLNGMKGDVVKINQKLAVRKTEKPKVAENSAKTTATEKSSAKTEKPKAEPIASKKAESDPDSKKREEVRPLPPADSELVVVKPERASRSGKETSEVGLAEAIDGELSTPQYLALHKTAPVGTVIRMTNEITGVGVFVKVIGKLPDTGLNEDVLIKVSRNAYDRIGASGRRFTVRLDYYR